MLFIPEQLISNSFTFIFPPFSFILAMMWPLSHSTSNPYSEIKSAVALAIDIGTSSVRAALYDMQGTEIDESSVRHERALLTTVDGGAEIDGDEAIAQVARTIDEVLSKAPRIASQIEFVAISCLWHSLVGIDRTARAITPVYGWADTRAAQQTVELQRVFDERATHSRTGCRFHPSYWPAKLLWLRQKNQDTYRSVDRWLSLSELLILRFFGDASISVSMASGTGLIDQRKCCWDEDLLSHLELDVDNFPAIAESGISFSGLVKEYATRWPALSKARWFPAIGDGAANSIGVGCVTRDRTALMIGTSGAMRVLWSGQVPETTPPELWCYRADRQRVIMGGALSDGGGLFGWMKEALKLDGSDEEIERALGALGPDEHGLTVLPFWSGERSTGWHASASGTIVGLKHNTTQIEILRAAMEAIAYRFVLIASALEDIAPQTSIIASGGALSSSPVWTQMIADVQGRPINLAGPREASSRGAVLLALEMEGKIASIEEVPELPATTYYPDMKRHVRYREALERQQELYARLIT